MSDLSISEVARMGGNAKFKKVGVEGMKEMSAKAAEARKKKREQKLKETQS